MKTWRNQRCECQRTSKRQRSSSLQLGVLSFRRYENGDICIRIFPKREELLIRGTGFGVVALHRVGSADLEMRECSEGRVQYDATMANDFLKLVPPT